MGNFKAPVSLAECCELVKRKFCLDHVRVFGDLNAKIMRAAVCPGSGKSVIDAAVLKGAEVLITGDIGHHEGIDAVAKGLSIIDAGHYGTEFIFLNDMKEYFRNCLPEIKTASAGIEHPFQTV